MKPETRSRAVKTVGALFCAVLATVTVVVVAGLVTGSPIAFSNPETVLVLSGGLLTMAAITTTNFIASRIRERQAATA